MPPPTPSVLFRSPWADRREGRKDTPQTEIRDSARTPLVTDLLRQQMRFQIISKRAPFHSRLFRSHQACEMWFSATFLSDIQGP